MPRGFIMGLVLCGLSWTTSVSTYAAAGGSPGDAELLAAVAPFPQRALVASGTDARARALMEAYYNSILAWGRIVHERGQAVPERPDQRYLGDGGNTEDHVRPICYAAMVQAFLAIAEPPEGAAGKEEREAMAEDAQALLRYLTQAHVSGGGACLNGRPWGDQWQSAMWARAAGLAGWMLWSRLDSSQQLALTRLVEHEADRFLQEAPKSSEYNDTGAEENAWNALITSLATVMLPRHPHAPAWRTAAQVYLYNTFSVAADQEDPTPGDEGKPIRDWVSTVNAHPDFTVENHGLVHVGYLKNSLSMLLESAVHFAMTDAEVPAACLHHATDVFQVLVKCMSDSGSPIYFGGNDWKLVHTQATDAIIYALLSLLTNNGTAACLEAQALKFIPRIQTQQGGYYNVRRDLEYGGLCATRLVSCYLAHAAMGPGAEPISAQAFQESASHVTHLEYAQAILHRTPDKFVSFAWGPRRMALAWPAGSAPVVWPHMSSYLGIINGEESDSRHSRLSNLRHEVGADYFWVAGTLQRLEGKLVQDFAFLSPPGPMAVYFERLTAQPGVAIASRETGVVGHEYDFDGGPRSLYSQAGAMRLVGEGNPARVHELASYWLNLGDRIGYVIGRLAGRENVVRYHDFTRGSGRVPKLEEWFSLIGERDPAGWSATGDWACVVTFLHQGHEDTRQWSGQVRFDFHDQRAACRVGPLRVSVDFASMQVEMQSPAAP